MARDVEAEIRDFKRRVSELEGSFGSPTRQIQGVHKDLLDFEEKTSKKFAEHDSRFDRLETKVDNLDRKINSLDRKIDVKVDGLAKSLPTIVSESMREVLREQRER